MVIEKKCKDCVNILVKAPYEYLLMVKNFEMQLPVEVWVCSECLEIKLYFTRGKK